jgi:hypothetical protein
MTRLTKSKITAFLIHIGLSVFIISTFLAIVWFVWYPEPFFELEGGWSVVAILAMVDIIIGPLLTFIVFNPEKKELYFDLAVIAVLQLSAFGYGSFTIFTERPLYVAYSEEGFSIIPAASINTDELTDKSLKNGFFDSPRFVYIQIPVTHKERQALVNELTQKGKNIYLLPKYYRPYQQNLPNVATGMLRLNVSFLLKNYPEEKERLTQMAQGIALDKLILYPLQTSMKKQVIVLKPSDGSMLGVLNINP